MMARLVSLGEVLGGEEARPQQQGPEGAPEAAVEVRERVPTIVQQRAEAARAGMRMLAALGAVRALQVRPAVAAPGRRHWSFSLAATPG